MTRLLLLLLVLVVACQAFVRLPSSSTTMRRTPTQQRRGSNLKMMMLPPEAPQSFLTSSAGFMIAASRFIKDVPSTLTEMADEAAGAVTGSSTTGGSSDAYTLPDGTYANAGEVAEEVYDKLGPELPPPYYAVAFALFLLVVSGVQQLSLGNVFDDEEKSASSSGAVARRMNMRNRSFFKKK